MTLGGNFPPLSVKVSESAVEDAVGMQEWDSGCIGVDGGERYFPFPERDHGHVAAGVARLDLVLCYVIAVKVSG